MWQLCDILRIIAIATGAGIVGRAERCARWGRDDRLAVSMYQTDDRTAAIIFAMSG